MIRRNSFHRNSSKGPALPTAQRRPAALLWDESFLWGIMAYKALQAAGLPFDLVRAEDIRNGGLEGYPLLFVPGGWSSNKMKALGEAGAEAIRDFVQSGGNYLGFCGGAGLATEDGIGLLSIRRKPTKERVPSFSGRIKLTCGRHPVWNSVHEQVFHAWWPPQFDTPDKDIRVLAKYDRALPDSFSSDLNTGDISASGRWTEMEQRYQINLDPARLINEPAVIEGIFGKGRVILSLVHFDTPGDANGSAVLKNIWGYLADHRFTQGSSCIIPCNTASECRVMRPSAAELSIAAALESAVSDVIDLGSRNFLWFRRNTLLLQWRRGVRGLEYNTLQVMTTEMASLLKKGTKRNMESELKALGRKLIPFLGKAGDLLVRERMAMQQGHITYEQCGDPEIQRIREELFSTSKSYGGQFKEIIDNIDSIIYRLVKQEQGL